MGRFRYRTRYMNSAQGDPIIRRHKYPQTCREYCRRLYNRIKKDRYAHSYRGEQIDEQGRVIAVYYPASDDWETVEFAADSVHYRNIMKSL